MMSPYLLFSSLTLFFLSLLAFHCGKRKKAKFHALRGHWEPVRGQRWLSRAPCPHPPIQPHQSPCPVGYPGKSPPDHCFSSSVQHRLDLPSISLQQHAIIPYHAKVFLLPTCFFTLFNNF